MPTTAGASDSERPELLATVITMMGLLEDLAAEHTDLERILAGLDAESWDVVTPSEPWSVRDQISHLAFFDERAALSVQQPEAFMLELNGIAEVGIDGYMSRHLELGRSMTPMAVAEWWSGARLALLDAFRNCDPERRVPWYGPPMRAWSSAAARLMETWAHGLDVADALGITRAPTDRLFRIADLGVRTFRFSYENRGLAAPEGRVRVALEGPAGRREVWNDQAPDSIAGPVEDFCKVITQRIHLADTALICSGPIADEWIMIAQVFAGPPGPGRPVT